MEIGGFRASYWVCAVAMGFFGLMVAILVRNKPQDMGLKPLGDGEPVKGRRHTNRQIGFAGLTMKELWTSPAFYLMMICVSMAGISVYLAFTVIHPFIVDSGYSPAAASAVQSTMMLLLTVAKILTGYLNDHLGARKVFLMSVVSAVIGMLILVWTENYYLIFAAVVIYTASLPLTTLLFPLLATDVFGYRAHPQYTGILLSILSVTSFAGEYITNFMRDCLGSYHPSVLLGVILAVLSAVIFWVIHIMTKQLPESHP